MGDTFNYGDMATAIDSVPADPPAGNPSAGNPQAAEAAKMWAPKADGQPDNEDETVQLVENSASAAAARVYEWEDEFGDVGPRIPELEKELFGEFDSSGQGIDFSK